MAVPTPLLVGERLRLLFGPRDERGRTRVASLEVDPAAPTHAGDWPQRPALDLGPLGAFDDSGAMPSCLVTGPGGTDELYLFYIGWNQGVSVPYRNAIGVAVSTDGGATFERLHPGPVVDRAAREPFFVTTPYVIHENGTWRMWYASGTAWMGDPPDPLYVIKYAESANGVEWSREDLTCITPLTPDEANCRPWVMRDGNRYRMWFSFRNGSGFRDRLDSAYRMGYAESDDGIVWERRDDEAGLVRSEDGFDSQMVAYPAIYDHRGTRHLLYNGNGFGRSGMGHAVAERSG